MGLRYQQFTKEAHKIRNPIPFCSRIKVVTQKTTKQNQEDSLCLILLQILTR